jgi:mycothione reductase
MKAVKMPRSKVSGTGRSHQLAIAMAWHDEQVQHFDLCIIGSGSANTIPGRRLAKLQIAMVEGGTFGGICLNVGCIPTKMLAYPADLARTPPQAARLGIDLELRRARWLDIRDRVFGRIDAKSASGEKFREDDPSITLFREPAHFVAPRTLDVGSSGMITADRFVIGAGSRSVIPDLDGLSGVDYHTSDTVMRIAELPESMIILGGGYVAAEFAHIFSALGTQVTVVNRSSTLLRKEDREVSERFTELFSERATLLLNTTVDHVTQRSDGKVLITARTGGGPRSTLEADLLLVATGRVPNGDMLNLAAAGVEVDADGFIVVDDHQRTTAEGVFALGDAASHAMLKHVANAEARIVKYNLLNPSAMISSDHRFIPHAVFSDPQVAAVGLTEEKAREQHLAYRVGRAEYGDTAYGWAMEDSAHFVKVLADPTTDQLLGAHLIGPQASSLIQPLIQAMTFGTQARTVARDQYWIHPAMAEVVENALLDLKQR